MDTAEVMARLPFPLFVKPANLGSSVGISKAHNCGGAGSGAGAGRRVRPQDHRGARHRGARVRVRGAGQRGAGGFAALRDSALARVLRLRRQVSAGPGEDSSCPRICRRRRRRSCGGWRWSVIARWSAKAWRASISCWRAPRASSTSTRSIPFPDSRRSACIRRCGSTRAFRIPKLIDRLIELALERHAAKKATRFTR